MILYENVIINFLQFARFLAGMIAKGKFSAFPVYIILLFIPSHLSSRALLPHHRTHNIQQPYNLLGKAGNHRAKIYGWYQVTLTYTWRVRISVTLCIYPQQPASNESEIFIDIFQRKNVPFSIWWKCRNVAGAADMKHGRIKTSTSDCWQTCRILSHCGFNLMLFHWCW